MCLSCTFRYLPVHATVRCRDSGIPHVALPTLHWQLRPLCLESYSMGLDLPFSAQASPHVTLSTTHK
jgi:hypothetical protein